MCNKCGNIGSHGCGSKRPCGCSEPLNCGCKSKTEFTCVNYTGKHLENIDVLPGYNGDRVLEKIDERVEDLYNQISLIDIPDSSNSFENVGGGVEVLKDKDTNITFKTLVGTSSVKPASTSENISFNVDEEWVKSKVNEYQRPPDPVVVKSVNNVGDGVDLIKSDNRELTEVRGIKSGTLNIRLEGDNVVIDTVEQKGVNDFYVDDSVVGEYIPDGTPVKPYKTLEEVINIIVGRGTRVQPEKRGARIYVRKKTNITSTDLFINDCTIVADNSKHSTIDFIYTGTDDYFIDIEKYYQSSEVIKDENGYPNISLTLKLEGDMSITRRVYGKTGLIRVYGWHRKSDPDKEEYNRRYSASRNLTYLGVHGKLILTQSLESIKEGDGNPMTFSEGGFIANNYGANVDTNYRYYTNNISLNPLIDVKYDNYFINGIPMIFHNTLELSLVGGCAGIRSGEGQYISYKDIKFQCTDHVANVKSSNRVRESFYEPLETTNVIELENGGGIHGGNISTYVGGLAQWVGPHSVIKIKGGAPRTYSVDMDLREGSSKYIFDISEAPSIRNINFTNNIGNASPSIITTISDSLVHTSVTENIDLLISDSIVNNFVKVLSNSGTNYTFNTSGLFAYVKNTPVMNPVRNFSDNGAAIGSGLVRGSLYYNSTDNKLDIVK